MMDVDSGGDSHQGSANDTTQSSEFDSEAITSAANAASQKRKEQSLQIHKVLHITLHHCMYLDAIISTSVTFVVSNAMKDFVYIPLALY